MLQHRVGEAGAIPPRSDRIFRDGRAWFFLTREGATIGPYVSRTECETGLQDFIEFLRLATPPLVNRLVDSLRVAANA